MTLDFETKASGQIEFFDCRTGATLFHLPRFVAWLALPLWHALWRSLR